ncbi:MAG TPA: succinate dehydrogenase iron-sulfur subunit [Terriglobales bacterium]|jgi:succinate dehydrogenase / fumarate reductase, iron-sulfur subunit|nr:succinate dehydrogenase iron-sulfur subunit [Terriglobales bacterium]
MANDKKTVIIKIKRQLTPDAKPAWEEFELPYRRNMNVTSALMDIAANPVTRDGKKTTPVTYDSNCLEEVCGSCAMLINGRARMACSALLDSLEQPIKLEPFSKFPIVRDLAVDRSVLFENLKAVKAWVPIDGTYDLGPGPRLSMQEQEAAYPLSRCISCCCCMEACPQFNEDTDFVGAAAISQARLFNTHPTGAALKRDRLTTLMGDGGIQECGYAQNCVEICPKDIPLTKSISEVGREVMKQAVGDLFRK